MSDKCKYRNFPNNVVRYHLGEEVVEDYCMITGKWCRKRGKRIEKCIHILRENYKSLEEQNIKLKEEVEQLKNEKKGVKHEEE